MPVTAPASRQHLREAGLVFLPSQGGECRGRRGVSGLEQSQNATPVRAGATTRLTRRLHAIMREIHEDCVARGGAGPVTDYFRGANVSPPSSASRAPCWPMALSEPLDDAMPARSNPGHRASLPDAAALLRHRSNGTAPQGHGSIPGFTATKAAMPRNSGKGSQPRTPKKNVPWRVWP
jgi:hypothetical protein